MRAVHAELCAGARAQGEPAPSLEEVHEMAALLRAEPAVPADLVPSLQAALAGVARPQALFHRNPHAHAVHGSSSRHRRADFCEKLLATVHGKPGLRALARLLWAEVRFLPLSFFTFQAALLAMAWAANRYLTGFAGPGPAGAGSGSGEAVDLVTRAVLRDALGGSVDAFTLVSPWLGLAVALLAALPRRRALWADLEALSPLSGAARLLARAAVATLVTVAATVAAGLAQRGSAPATLLLLARTAPLFLAVAWALVWSIPFGAPGGVAGSLALWGGMALAGGRLGSWNLYAPPGAATPARLAALLVAAALLAVAWALAGRCPAPAHRVHGRHRP